MKIASFSVENYRSITKARRIELSENTVLVGPNNEGKSNILRALSAAMYSLMRPDAESAVESRFAAQRDGDTGRHYNWARDIPISQRSKRDAKTVVTLEFQLSEEEVTDFKSEIRSNLNGLLPVQVIFARHRPAEIKIVKRGPGSKTLNAKGSRIASFLARRIQFQYIPAVRTAEQATNIVERMISAELRSIEANPAYREAIEKIRELQKPILDRFSNKSTETLRAFLPDIKNVEFRVSDERRYSALRQSIDITVDDGAKTHLSQKGDGVQSLVALGLRRHVLEENRKLNTYLFAIEEPEAHLHAEAIYALKSVINELSEQDQIIITTHNGIFTNRSSIKSNVIVNKSKANPAKNLSEIRRALGIKSVDNLLNASLILLVEGDEDKLALRGILPALCGGLEHHLKNGSLVIESLGGAGGLSAKASLYKSILCSVHCFLDFDASGKSALDAALNRSIISDADYHYAMVGGKKESEFEDLIEKDLIQELCLQKFSVDLAQVKPRNRNLKFSARIADQFRQVGKPFGDIEKQRLKFLIGEAVAADPLQSINARGKPIFLSLAETVERKLQEQ